MYLFRAIDSVNLYKNTPLLGSHGLKIVDGKKNYIAQNILKRHIENLKYETFSTESKKAQKERKGIIYI